MNREVMTSEHRHDTISDCFQSSEVLDPVIYTICQSLPAEKIFLLGMYPANPTTLGTEYDLMVLVDTTDKRPMHEFESLINNRCHDLAVISVSVFQIQIVIQLLKAGNIFFSFICDPLKIIYDRCYAHLSNGDIIDRPSQVNKITNEFSVLFSKSKSFFEGAVNYEKTKDFQLAAFMVHQCLEQALNAFLYPFMGYRMHTHNLNKLFLYARRFSIRFYEIFPRDTDQEIQLYQTIHKAYIYGRYKNNFLVEESVLQILISRASRLLELTESIFYERVEVFQSGKSVF